jgi:hypothetical protein
VLWVVHLDPRGSTSVVYRCKQAIVYQCCILSSLMHTQVYPCMHCIPVYTHVRVVYRFKHAVGAVGFVRLRGSTQILGMQDKGRLTWSACDPFLV